MLLNDSYLRKELPRSLHEKVNKACRTAYHLGLIDNTKLDIRPIKKAKKAMFACIRGVSNPNNIITKDITTNSLEIFYHHPTPLMFYQADEELKNRILAKKAGVLTFDQMNSFKRLINMISFVKNLPTINEIEKLKKTLQGE